MSYTTDRLVLCITKRPSLLIVFCQETILNEIHFSILESYKFLEMNTTHHYKKAMKALTVVVSLFILFKSVYKLAGYGSPIGTAYILVYTGALVFFITGLLLLTYRYFIQNKR